MPSTSAEPILAKQNMDNIADNQSASVESGPKTLSASKFFDRLKKNRTRHGEKYG